MNSTLKSCYWKYLLVCLAVLSCSFPVASQTEAHRALVLNVDDAIGPAIADYIHHGLNVAAEKHVELVILQLDTPGGLDTAMRRIIRDILGSTIPVVVYVSPSGARAASAGTYITYAAHVAAMAPGTNLGAATPIQIGGLPGSGSPSATPPGPQAGAKGEKQGEGTAGKGEQSPGETDGDTEQRKMVNDAVAYIRSLAELRGRNGDWGELAVRRAESLSAQEALDKNVIDVIAGDIPELLKKIDGRTVQVNGHLYTLKTSDLDLVRLDPGWRNRLLAVITNPTVAYMLMLLGIYGLFFEVANPGHLVPGVIGAVSLLLALYAMQVLPVNYAGLALIITGIAFMIAELFVPSFGALGIGGIIAFIIGSVILFDRESGGMAISLPLIIAVALVTAAFFLIAIRVVVAAHRKPVVSGMEELIGAVGEVLEDFAGTGYIHVHGETWQARCSVPVRSGARVRIKSLDGLILNVEPEQKENAT